MRNDRWEYKVEELKPGFLYRNMQPEHLAETLNREGVQGWELINVVAMGASMKAFFKRAR